MKHGASLLRQGGPLPELCPPGRLFFATAELDSGFNGQCVGFGGSVWRITGVKEKPEILARVAG